jgi:phosphoserine phosphatase RsbU/P
MDDLNATDGFIREQLQDRRERLLAAVPTSSEPARLTALLGEVDSALARMEAGTYGICEECHDTIEKSRLVCDPLIRYCLDHLTREERTALEQDLELAARMQRDMLPQPHTQVGSWEVFHHYRGLGPVSGDYCDVICADGDGQSLFFALGDASGKGVAASMLMAHLHAIFRTLVPSGLPVDGLMTQASRVFRESAIAPHFATLVCGRAKASGEIELSNAGHCPPLLLQNSRARRIEGSGLPLGLFANGCYCSQTVELNPGDTLLIYTDGTSEARNRSDVEYGEPRLAQIAARSRGLGAKGLVGACLEDLDTFLAGAPLADDLTLMAIRRVN